MPEGTRRRRADLLERSLSRPGLVLVVFELPGSETCRAIEAVIDEVSRELAGRVPVIRVDVGRDALADRYRVQEVPTVAFYHDGRELGRIEGTVGPATIRAHLEFLLRQQPVSRRPVVVAERRPWRSE